MTMRRVPLGVALSVGIFLAAAVLLPFVGAGPIDVGKVLRREGPDFEILLQLRVTRTLLALLAGAALSLAGALFQAMLRDGLADPYTLGISAGASLGAVVTIAAGWDVVLGLPATWGGSVGRGVCGLAAGAGRAGCWARASGRSRRSRCC